MIKETDLKKLFEKKYFEFKKVLLPARKSGRNTHFNSTFSTYEDLVDAVKPALFEVGLSYRHVSKLENGIYYVGTKLIDSETGYEDQAFFVECLTGKMQETGSSLSYAERYTLEAITGSSSGDDDGNAAQNLTKKNKDLSKRETPKKPTGFNPDNIDHAEALERALEKKGIPHEEWEFISKQMTGKSFTDLDKVLGGK